MKLQNNLKSIKQMVGTKTYHGEIKSGGLRLFFQVFYLITFFLFISASSALSNNSYQLEAKNLVQKLHIALSNSMKNAKKDTTQTRYNLLKPVIEETFHISTIAKISAGYFWHKGTKNNRNGMVKELTRLTTATYISQFNNFSGERFIINQLKLGPQNTTLVETSLVRPKGKTIKLVYVIKQLGYKFGIIDVLMDIGISELAKKRSEYQKVLKKKGLSGLVIALKTKSDSILRD